MSSNTEHHITCTFDPGHYYNLYKTKEEIHNYNDKKLQLLANHEPLGLQLATSSKESEVVCTEDKTCAGSKKLLISSLNPKVLGSDFGLSF